MVQDLFFVELGKRTGSAIPTVRKVSHPLLPTRAAVEQCVQLVFGNMYANYQWMQKQSEEGHTISANGSDRAGTEDEGKTQAQKQLEAQMNYLILSGQASTTGEAKEKATAYYTPSGTLTAGAAGTTVVAETEPQKQEGVITGVRLVAMAGISDGSVRVGGVENDSVDTAKIIENSIKERVKERLNARLASMTIEQRAEARGLLRLQAEGRLDEYFEKMFAGDDAGAEELLGDESAETDGGGYKIMYLLDEEAVLGAGHAAVIMGSDSEGWYYFSFGPGLEDQGIERYATKDGNMDTGFFVTLSDARNSTELNRYTSYLSWDLQDTTVLRAAFRSASEYLNEPYNLLTNNCDDIASEIIRSAGVPLSDSLQPSSTFNSPGVEFDSSGTWKILPSNE